MNRIEKLRAEALRETVSVDESNGYRYTRQDAFYYQFFKRYFANRAEDCFARYADALYGAFSALPPVISDGELIVGRYPLLSGAEAEEWNTVYSDMAWKEVSKYNCGQNSHMAIDYELVLQAGLNGIIQKIKGYLENCEAEKIAFYQSCKKSLEAVIQYAENYSKQALEMAESERNPERRAELERLSQICKKVPANPAENFYEAVQSVHFITHAISVNPFLMCAQQFQLGHPDRYLLPYYQKDIKSGAITKTFAQLLLDCLGIQINHRVPSGLSSGYMVGGRDENNEIVENDLTLLCMQVVDDIRLVYPAVGLCYTDGMEGKYLEKACEIISHGCSHPAIFNDDIITKGLESYGVPKEQAHNYIHSTCVEITPVASSNVWVASPYTNMAQILLDNLDREYDSFAELMDAIFCTIDEKIKRNFEEQLSFREIRAQHTINPLLSCFVHDCLARGCDIEQGGARYHWIMPSFVGMANLVDSLYAVKEVVFDKKERTCKELKAICDSNFEGNEVFRQRMLHSVSKYGNDVDDIDKYFGMITEHIISECKKYTGMFSNAQLIPSVFCWVMHDTFGRETGATPDGRLKGFPLGDGSGPCQGREQNGPTASILSSTKWAHHALIGGVAVNMKFSKKSLGALSAETMQHLVRTYLKRGGFEMQINVVDQETLKKAVDCPEAYSDLVVRIGGYSDYFVKLSLQMQQEVILRTEHVI